MYTAISGLYSHCGDDSGEDPPVLIPNTEVKLSYAESTWVSLPRKDRKLPHLIEKDTLYGVSFFVAISIKSIDIFMLGDTI